MIIIKDFETFQKRRANLNGTVGFVPTMGALHRGHLSLIQKSKEENDFTVVSIFVNPTQFLEGEDLDKYPRKEEADMTICEKIGVDILFMPTIDNIYFKDELKVLAPAIAGYVLEGARRPGHFDGVLQIVMKLFNIVQPNRAYFGKKDAQQLLLIQKMVHDMFIPIDIVPCNTIREADGLAMSSRNVYLSAEERKRALAISKSLKRAGKMIMSGVKDVKTIKEEMISILRKYVKIEYVEIVDRDLSPIDNIIEDKTIILVAARVGDTRLIDNIWI